MKKNKDMVPPVNPRLGQVGGQAVMEGVMMRSPKTIAVAVRRVDDQEIVVRSKENKTIRTKYKFLDFPIIRGVVNLVEVFRLSFSTLTASTEMMGLEGTEYEEEPSKFDQWLDAHFGKKMLSVISVVSFILGLALALGLFVALPAGVTNLMLPETIEGTWKIVEINGVNKEQAQKDISGAVSSIEYWTFDDGVMTSFVEFVETGNTVPYMKIAYSAKKGYLLIGSKELSYQLENDELRIFEGENETYFLREGTVFWRNRLKCLIEGIVKVLIFIAYLWLTSLMKDIKRVYQYHGAEHKSIFCYEAGLDLTVENVKKQSRFHPRCGTSFMFVMVFVSILISVVLIPDVWGWLRVLLKLCLLPICVGLGYEFIKYAGKHDNKLTHILSAPGLWMQRITTREPDDSMMEVAIVSIKSALRDEFPDFEVPFEKDYLERKQKAEAEKSAESSDGTESDAPADHTEATEATESKEATGNEEIMESEENHADTGIQDKAD